MPRIFLKWPLSWNMLHIVYQHDWRFNLETLLMSRIFCKWPHSWKMLSTIYQYSKWINLIGNYHNFILKFKKSSWNIIVNVIQLKTFGLKRGVLYQWIQFQFLRSLIQTTSWPFWTIIQRPWFIGIIQCC
jgi:hypothetical protein